LRLQSDGNLVTVNAQNQAVWAAFLYQPPGTARAPYKLIMQGDSNLVYYDKNMVAVWNTETFKQA